MGILWRLRRRQFLQGPGPKGERKPDIIWHGIKPNNPDFSAKSKAIAFVLDGSQTGREPDADFYVACSAYAEPVPFRIPSAPCRRSWRRVVDTSLAAPLEIIESEDGPRVPAGSSYLLAPFAMVIMVSQS